MYRTHRAISALWSALLRSLRRPPAGHRFTISYKPMRARAELGRERTIQLQRLGPAPIAADGHAEADVELSIVVPVYNEAAGLGEFFARLLAVLEHLRLSYEI